MEFLINAAAFMAAGYLLLRLMYRLIWWTIGATNPTPQSRYQRYRVKNRRGVPVSLHRRR